MNTNVLFINLIISYSDNIIIIVQLSKVGVASFVLSLVCIHVTVCSQGANALELCKF